MLSLRYAGLLTVMAGALTGILMFWMESLIFCLRSAEANLHFPLYVGYSFIAYGFALMLLEAKFGGLFGSLARRFFRPSLADFAKSTALK